MGARVRAGSGWAMPWLCVGGVAMLLLSGCGTPGAPQPPSLRLAEPVADLAAARAGNAVTLTWTNPKKTTDGAEIASFQAEMEADLCRAEGETVSIAADCAPVRKMTVKPGGATTATDMLPTELAAGKPRALRYWVVLRNERGRTAGVSNVALSAAGQAPKAVAGLTATASAAGVVLRWQADGTATPVRLHRHLVRGAAKRKSSGSSSAPAEAVDEDLMVDAPATAGQAGAVDREARFDEVYSYAAERVMSVERTALAQTAAASQTGAAMPRGKAHHAPVRRGAQHTETATPETIEIDSTPSAAVTVATTDVFPPAVPQDVVATYTAATHSVDLSWTPDTEPDLAGYFVYRCEDCGDGGQGSWTRVSSAEPVEFPAYSDAEAQAGRVYRYAVSAVDEHGNESGRSQAVTVSTQQ